LDVLAQMYKPKKVTPTVMKFVDVAGLVAGASRGEGMGIQFLSNIRELDALAMVVRSFSDPNVQHVDSKLDPRRDMAMVNLELALADLDVVNKRREKIAGTARLKPGAKEKEELELLDRLAAHLDEGKPIRTLSFDPEQAKLFRSFSFLTAGDPEVRAWTVRQAAKAPEAAGVIHSDIERGFIKAEIVAYDDLIAAGSYAAARERGKVRLEGRDYVIKDGDVCLFRFNV